MPRNEVIAGSEWVRVPRPGETLLGLGNFKVNSLIGSKSIRSISVSDKPGQRATRLVFLPSIREYLERLATEQNSRPATLAASE